MKNETVGNPRLVPDDPVPVEEDVPTRRHFWIGLTVALAAVVGLWIVVVVAAALLWDLTVWAWNIV